MQDGIFTLYVKIPALSVPVAGVSDVLDADGQNHERFPYLSDKYRNI